MWHCVDLGFNMEKYLYYYTLFYHTVLLSPTFFFPIMPQFRLSVHTLLVCSVDPTDAKGQS